MIHEIVEQGFAIEEKGFTTEEIEQLFQAAVVEAMLFQGGGEVEAEIDRIARKAEFDRDTVARIVYADQFKEAIKRPFDDFHCKDALADVKLAFQHWKLTKNNGIQAPSF